MCKLTIFLKKPLFDDFINLINTSKTTLLTSNKLLKWCELVLTF